MITTNIEDANYSSSIPTKSPFLVGKNWEFFGISAIFQPAKGQPSRWSSIFFCPRCTGHRQLDIVQAPFGCPADCGPLGRCTLENTTADPYVLGGIADMFCIRWRPIGSASWKFMSFMSCHFMSCHFIPSRKIPAITVIAGIGSGAIRRQAAAPWPQAARVPTRRVGFHHHHKALAPGSWRQLDLPSGKHTKNV